MVYTTAQSYIPFQLNRQYFNPKKAIQTILERVIFGEEGSVEIFLNTEIGRDAPL